MNNNGPAWCVMGSFATIPLQSSVIEMKNLSLKEETEYLAFDFWEEKYMGIVKNEISCKELKVGQCQIISLHELKEVPNKRGFCTIWYGIGIP